MGRTLEIILGPTGVGKTGFSIERALEYGSPIISCDSRQIFKEIPIGTAAPSAQDLARVKHYFIGTYSVTEPYTAARYENEALALIDHLFSEGHERLVMTGGSMLYIDAVCNGLDDIPEVPISLRAHLMDCLRSEGLAVLTEQLRELDPATWEKIDKSNSHRVIRALEVSLYTGQPFSSFQTHTSRKRDFEIVKTGLMREREELYERIDRRVIEMVEGGLEEEARRMVPYRDLPALQTVGYREFFEYFDGLRDLDSTIALIQRNSRHYAKRQLTWWHRDPSIRWIEL